MIVAQLWAGVVFLIVAGLVALFNLRSYVAGRYFVEMHSAGLEKSFWFTLRWFWIAVYSASAILFFYLAFWLVRYIFTHPALN